MTQYTADPRAEELQLLMQLYRSKLITTHSETVHVADRLEARAEAVMWADRDAQLWLDITKTGEMALHAAGLLTRIKP